jgi:hypothetical protein
VIGDCGIDLVISSGRLPVRDLFFLHLLSAAPANR